MTHIFDLHQDLLLPKNSPELFEYENIDQTGLEKIESSPISLVFASGFPHPQDGKHFDPHTFTLIESDFDTYIDHCNSHEGWHIVSNKELLEKVVNGEGRGIVLHVEGLNAFQGNNDEWKMLESWYRNGWRSVGIVWNYENSLGGGAESDAGLTTLGREFFEWCEARQMIIDTAHMNEKTFWETFDVLKGPLIATHANARELCDRPRNFTEEQVAAIGERGGVVGVFFPRNFLCAGGHDASIATIIDHIKYIEEHGGKEAIALGTDFGGNISRPIEGMETVEQLPNLFEAFLKNGYSVDDCERIGWRNAYRVMKEVLPS